MSKILKNHVKIEIKGLPNIRNRDIKYVLEKI
jgi:hypothetical protein